MLQGPKNKGGLKLVDFQAKYDSLMMSWVTKLQEKDPQYFWLDPQMGELIWEANLKFVHIEKLFDIDSHWHNVLWSWAKYHYCEKFEGEEIKTEILWYNSCVLVNNLPMVKTKCIENGLIHFEDLLDEEGNKLSLEDIVNRYGPCLNWFEYTQLTNAIPEIWWYLANGKFRGKRKPSSTLYNYIISLHAMENMEGYIQKFTKEFGSCMNEEYCMFFKKIYKMTKDTRLRDFQYRQLLFKIFTNDTLYKWKVKESAKCDYCHENQNVQHLFLKCEKVQAILSFLKEINARDKDYLFKELFTCTLVEKSNALKEYSILLYKRFIFNFKCQNKKPTVPLFKKHLDK